MSQLMDALGTAGGYAGDALGYVGEALGKPGRAIRGGLGGDMNELAKAWIPFSDTLGLTDAADEVSGADLIRQFADRDVVRQQFAPDQQMGGVQRFAQMGNGPPENPYLDIDPDALRYGGAAIEMLLDPLNLLAGGGLLRGAGKVAGSARNSIRAGDAARVAAARPLARTADAASDLYRNADATLDQFVQGDRLSRAGQRMRIEREIAETDPRAAIGASMTEAVGPAPDPRVLARLRQSGMDVPPEMTSSDAVADAVRSTQGRKFADRSYSPAAGRDDLPGLLESLGIGKAANGRAVLPVPAGEVAGGVMSVRGGRLFPGEGLVDPWRTVALGEVRGANPRLAELQAALAELDAAPQLTGTIGDAMKLDPRGKAFQRLLLPEAKSDAGHAIDLPFGEGLPLIRDHGAAAEAAVQKAIRGGLGRRILGQVVGFPGRPNLGPVQIGNPNFNVL